MLPKLFLLFSFDETFQPFRSMYQGHRVVFIIGIYYFKDGENLKKELQYLLDNNIKEKGEFQLTNALENMKQKGLKFKPGQVTEWLDCGNKDATVYTNHRVLEFDAGKESLKGENIKNVNSIIIEPCYIGNNVTLINSVIGPHASIGNGTRVENSVISNSIIQHDAKIKSALLNNSLIGVAAEINGKQLDLSISDYSQILV
jgi:glucose-1-phosphate thymidylyltransferase